MVDRITPQTTDADRAFLAEEYGLVDRWPVVAETFIQWVIEDDFPYGRPPYEDVGVLMTGDVRPVRDTQAAHPQRGPLHDAYMAALVGSHLHPRDHGRPAVGAATAAVPRRGGDAIAAAGPGHRCEEYKRVVAERFANPEVRDQVARVCLDGTSKFPKFLVPTIELQLDRGGQVQVCLRLPWRPGASTCWARTTHGRDITLSADPTARGGGRVRTCIRRRAGRPSWTSAMSSASGCPRTHGSSSAFVEALGSIRSGGHLPYSREVVEQRRLMASDRRLGRPGRRRTKVSPMFQG